MEGGCLGSPGALGTGCVSLWIILPRTEPGYGSGLLRPGVSRKNPVLAGSRDLPGARRV